MELATDITIDVVELPENLPKTIQVPQTSYEIDAGETLEFFYEDVVILDGEIPEGLEAQRNYHFDGDQFPNSENMEDRISICFENDGRYQIDAVVEISNYIVRQPITIIVGSGISEDVEIVEGMFFETQYVNFDDINWVADLELFGYELFEGEQLEWTIERIDGNDINPGQVLIDVV